MLRIKNEEQEAHIKNLSRAQAEQEERDKLRGQELAAMRKQMQKLAPQDKDSVAFNSGGGLVLASSKSEVNAEAVNSAAAQAVRPVLQQVVRIEREQRELIAYIMSHSDPVLKSHLEDLNSEAVSVMKKHDDVLGWQDRWMAVRRGTLYYADTYKDALGRVNSRADVAGDDHEIDLRGCSVSKCQAESDKAHFAFKLITIQVALNARLYWAYCCCCCCAHARSAVSCSPSPSC